MTLLAAVLDTMLPGGSGFPAAREVSLAEWVAARPAFADAVATVLAALPADFAGRDAAARTDMLANLERSAPDAFRTLLTAAYGGYYTNPGVLAVIERATGHAARPPQPEGYELAPFDPKLLDRMRRARPSYREVPVDRV